jgi:hypothetical protein
MIKRIEHYWKGLSAPRTQISAIPPQAYGDRFVNFITGITMTKEEAERRETQESHRVGDHIPVQSGSAENLGQPSSTLSPTERESPAVEKTMRRAQKQTDKATPSEKGRDQSEEEKPDRTLKTTEDARAAMTLPVVSESHESGESNRNSKRALSPPDEAEEESEQREQHSPLTTSSTPGLRKVSPSTVATATDMGEDDTSVSSPHTYHVDFEADTEDDEYHPKQEAVVADEVRPKPPRIASDLIQPQSPLEDSMFRSLDQHTR